MSESPNMKPKYKEKKSSLIWISIYKSNDAIISLTFVEAQWTFKPDCSSRPALKYRGTLLWAKIISTKFNLEPAPAVVKHHVSPEVHCLWRRVLRRKGGWIHSHGEHEKTRLRCKEQRKDKNKGEQGERKAACELYLNDTHLKKKRKEKF